MNWKKIVFPPIWLIILLVLFSAVSLPMVFIKDLTETVIAYILYVISFYTLTVVCILFSMVLPKRYKAIKQKIYDNPIGNRYMTDASFRTHVSLYLSLGINLIYVGINLISYILLHSMWFVILAIYYATLALMRFILLRYVRGEGIGINRLEELKRTKLCAFVLLTLNFALSGSVLMILYQDKGYNYPGFLIYVIALYTFYMTTHAIVDMSKFRKYNSPVMMTTKTIALSAALVSMLSLETAMFAQFGADMEPENQRLMIILTGAGVSVAVIAMSIYMIIKNTKEIRKLRSSRNGTI
ncbi:MAG: hypothetical protein IJE23_05915 [Tyzzerella sp.]|nr:hypothetical protein [Tyzzerella sp.]